MCPKFSVIITTYDMPDFLLECIQSFNNIPDTEILVGIDGCQKTKNHLKDIKVQENIRFFYFTSNCGTYTVRNNLIKETKGDTILFFDSDDLIFPFIFERYDNSYDIVRLKFEDFGSTKNRIEVAQGVFFIKKESLNKLVGFQDWKCNADVEFRLRAEFNEMKIKEDNIISFKRRKHDKNLTIKEDTGMKSKIRKNYQKIISQKMIYKEWSNPEIRNTNYYEI